MKKILFLSVAVVALMLVSCNKDQAAVKKLNGTWNVTASSTTNGGVTVDNMQWVDEIKMTFNECKLKTDEWCTGSTMTTAGSFSFTDNQLYRVTGDGTQLEVKSDTSSSSADIITINELTKTEMKLTQVDGNNTTVIEAEKQ